MPALLFARVNLDLIYPRFLAVALDVVARCNARGFVYVATHGTRTIAEQNALHAKWKMGVGGKAAPGGSSAHNYGCAFDFCRDASDLAGLQADWRQAAYNVLGEETRAAGLVWGGSFGDAPHINFPGVTTAKDMSPLLHLYMAQAGSATDAQRLGVVWSFLEKQVRTERFERANPRLFARMAALP